MCAKLSLCAKKLSPLVTNYWSCRPLQCLIHEIWIWGYFVVLLHHVIADREIVNTEVNKTEQKFPQRFTLSPFFSNQVKGLDLTSKDHKHLLFLFGFTIKLIISIKIYFLLCRIEGQTFYFLKKSGTGVKDFKLETGLLNSLGRMPCQAFNLVQEKEKKQNLK